MQNLTLQRMLATLGLIAASGLATAQAPAPDVLPLPPAKFNADQAAMGKYLFFDNRLSGDWGVSCATCHDPEKGWGDGKPLSTGYPSMEYFRNAPTILNATLKARFMWDGRLDGSDAGTLVRDMITETHTMNMDSRLMQERLKQVPEYNDMWRKFRKDDINGMRVYGVIGEFIKSVRSANVPFDKFKQGDEGALNDEQKAGYALFKGKAGCVACHNGPLGSDGKLHRTGVPEHPDVLKNPLRAITMLRHYSTSGMPNYMNARTDLGAYAITKDRADVGKFATPSLRDLKHTAPYMHNGTLATLDEVIDFYDKGGGPGAALKPLGLAAAEKQQLKAFLLSLSGDPVIVKNPGQPEMKVWAAYGKN